MTNDTVDQQLTDCLAAGQWEHARQLLVDHFGQPTTTQDRGAANAMLLSAYIRVTNQINLAYKAELDKTIELLKRLQSADKVMTEGLDVRAVRDDIAQS